MSVRPAVRVAIAITMTVVALLLALTVGYRVRGSLEWFPTAEQEAKVRSITTLLATGLFVAELGLWWLFRRTARERATRGK